MKKKLRLSKPAWIGVFVGVAAIIVVLGVAIASLFNDGGESAGADKSIAAGGEDGNGGHIEILNGSNV